MTYRKLLMSTIAVVLLTVVQSNAFSQTKKEQLKALFKPDYKSKNFQYLKNSNNELEVTASLLFYGYSNFLSSQDVNSCVFTPSCSVYAIQTIQHNKPITAYLKIFDRLTRCHPFTAKGEYLKQKNTNLNYDPAF